VTITRKQAEPTDNALIHRSSDGITTSEPPPRLWMGVMLQIAQDKRHDLAPEVLKFWAKKLGKIEDELICLALMSGRWKYFPAIDQVLDEIDRIRESRRQQAVNRDWANYKANQLKAEMEGRLATSEDYAEMRAALRRCFGDPEAKQTGKTGK